MNHIRKYSLFGGGALLIILLCTLSVMAARKKITNYQGAIIKDNDETRKLIGNWQRESGTLLILKPDGTGCFRSPSGRSYQGFDWTCQNGEFWFTQYGNQKPNLTNLAKVKRIVFDDTSMRFGSTITELNANALELSALSENKRVHKYVRVP